MNDLSCPRITIFHLMLLFAFGALCTGGGAFGWAYYNHIIQAYETKLLACEAKALSSPMPSSR